MRPAWKKLLTLGLCLLLCAALIPSALAAEEDEAVEIEFTAPDWSGPSNDALFKAYLNKLFFGSDGLQTKSPASLQQTLSPRNYAMEQRIKAQIQLVAAGEQTSTAFVIDISDLDMTDFGEEEFAALYNALLADCTSSLYWHDKRMGLHDVSYTSQLLNVSFPVAMDYRGSEYEVDSGKIDRANAALTTANGIISANAGKSDVEKLRAYMKEICRLNVYNHEAADYHGNDQSYGINAWQLVDVFDGDPDTNVVCEGYSKAFEYLCDNTAFTSSLINCWCVSGLADSDDPKSGHMWNVIRMDDGSNYVVDVTWSDSDDSAQTNYAMFLSYAVSGSPSAGYQLSYGDSGSVGVRTYADRMSTFYTADELTICSHAYNGQTYYDVIYDANGGEGAPASQTKYQGTALTLSSAEPTRAAEDAGSFTVTLDPNGGQCSSASLTANRSTAYSFAGWNTEINGSGSSYTPGGTYTADAAVTLYAQWTGTTSTAAVELPTPVWEGHTFLGWAESTDAASGVAGSYTPGASITLYAIWKAIPAYTVSYDANGGEGAPASQTKYQGTALTLSSAEPTRAAEDAGSFTVTLDPNGGQCGSASLSANRSTAYSFAGWNTEVNGSGSSYTPGGTYTADAAVTLYAQWTGTTSTAAVELPTPVWEGHTFLGWAESADAASGVTGSYTPGASITLHAIWKENLPQQLPVIVTQPQSQTVAEGKPVTFTVKAEGEALNYQWQALLPGNADWIDMSTQEGPTLSFTASVGQSGSRYRCRVYNAAGEKVSGEAVLTVVTMPRITTQPKAASVKAGKKVTFKVKAAGVNLTYQWYYQKKGTSKWVKIAKATKATYSFKATKKLNGYKYRCYVTNAAGTVKSKAVKLTVK